jgi:hypothetical protein
MAPRSPSGASGFSGLRSKSGPAMLCRGEPWFPGVAPLGCAQRPTSNKPAAPIPPPMHMLTMP